MHFVYHQLVSIRFPKFSYLPLIRGLPGLKYRNDTFCFAYGIRFQVGIHSRRDIWIIPGIKYFICVRIGYINRTIHYILKSIFLSFFQVAQCNPEKLSILFQLIFRQQFPIIKITYHINSLFSRCLKYESGFTNTRIVYAGSYIGRKRCLYSFT